MQAASLGQLVTQNSTKAGTPGGSSVSTLKSFFHSGNLVIIAAAVALLPLQACTSQTSQSGATPARTDVPQVQPAPRHVSADQATTLAAEMRGMNLGQVNVVYGSCSDCATFTDDLVRALRVADARLPDPEPGLNAPGFGIVILVPDLEHPSNEASALLAALTKAGIGAQLSSDPSNEHETTMYVGPGVPHGS
jgi:hypothetical protein